MVEYAKLYIWRFHLSPSVEWATQQLLLLSLHEVYFVEKDGKLTKECTLFFLHIFMHIHVSQQYMQSCNGLLMQQCGFPLCSLQSICMIQDHNYMNFISSWMQLPFFLFMLMSQWKTRRGCSQQLGGCNKWDIFHHSIR